MVCECYLLADIMEKIRVSTQYMSGTGVSNCTAGVNKPMWALPSWGSQQSWGLAIAGPYNLPGA